LGTPAGYYPGSPPGKHATVWNIEVKDVNMDKRGFSKLSSSVINNSYLTVFKRFLSAGTRGALVAGVFTSV
jgi:hypothetical protein